MKLSPEAIATLENSLKYSISNITHFDFTYGQSISDHHQFYQERRKQVLDSLLKAKDELTEYKTSLKKEAK